MHCAFIFYGTIHYQAVKIFQIGLLRIYSEIIILDQCPSDSLDYNALDGIYLECQNYGEMLQSSARYSCRVERMYEYQKWTF